MYEYRLREVLKVIDGDTVDCVIDLGFGLKANFRFRLTGVDTPERSHEDGPRATEMTRQWLALPGEVAVRTQKAGPSTSGIGDGSFGRWLGEFVREGQSLNDLLIAEGWGSNQP